MVELYMLSNHAGLADYDPRAVIYEKVGSDFGTRMDIDPRAGVRPLGHHTGQELDAFVVKKVRRTLDGNRLEAWIRKNNFLVIRCGGVALEGGLDIGAEEFTDGGNLIEKTEQNLGGVFIGRLRIVQANAPRDLRSEPLSKGLKADAGGFGEFVFMDRMLVVESRKQHLQQLLAQRINGAFGREIVAVGMIQPADRLVGGENFFGNSCEAALHSGETIGPRGDLSRIPLGSGSGAVGRQRAIPRSAEVAGGFVVRLGFVGFFHLKQNAVSVLHFD